eukprot:jgi/Botrbrau1/19118/Bobra.0077s0031.1
MNSLGLAMHLALLAAGLLLADFGAAEGMATVSVNSSQLASIPLLESENIPNVLGKQIVKTFTFSGYQWLVAPTGIVILGPTTLNSNNVIYPDANRAMTIKFSKINNNWYGSDVFTTAKLGFGTYQVWVTGDITRLDPNILFGMESLGTPLDGSIIGSTDKLDLKHGTPYGVSFLGNAFYFVWPPRRKAPIPWVGLDSFRYSLSAPFQSTHRIVWRSRSVTFSSYRGHRQLGDNSQQIRSWTFNGNTSQIPQIATNFHFLLYTSFGGGPNNNLPTTIQINNFTFVKGSA